MNIAEAGINVQALESHALFVGFSKAEIERMLFMGTSELLFFGKGQVVVPLGSPAERIGIVLSGKIVEQRISDDKEAHVLSPYLPGSVFGLEGAFSHQRRSPVQLISEQPGNALLLDISAVLNEVSYRDRMNANLLSLLAEKGIQDMLRMDVLLRPTLRERVIAFFQRIQRQTGNDFVELNMTQGELARYFSVNRSALSRELNRMQNDGLVQILPHGRYRIMQWKSINPPGDNRQNTRESESESKENGNL